MWMNSYYLVWIGILLKQIELYCLSMSNVHLIHYSLWTEPAIWSSGYKQHLVINSLSVIQGCITLHNALIASFANRQFWLLTLVSAKINNIIFLHTFVSRQYAIVQQCPARSSVKINFRIVNWPHVTFNKSLWTFTSVTWEVSGREQEER